MQLKFSIDSQPGQPERVNWKVRQPLPGQHVIIESHSDVEEALRARRSSVITGKIASHPHDGQVKVSWFTCSDRRNPLTVTTEPLQNLYWHPSPGLWRCCTRQDEGAAPQAPQAQQPRPFLTIATTHPFNRQGLTKSPKSAHGRLTTAPYERKPVVAEPDNYLQMLSDRHRRVGLFVGNPKAQQLAWHGSTVEAPRSCLPHTFRIAVKPPESRVLRPVTAPTPTTMLPVKPSLHITRLSTPSLVSPRRQIGRNQAAVHVPSPRSSIVLG